ADELAVGDFRLQNVLFLVLRDPPLYSTRARGHQGDLGRNVIMEFGTIRWSRDGWLEVGFPAALAKIRDANLCFDGLKLVANAVFQNANLYLLLDSGSTETVVLPRFGKDFPSALTANSR